jgi:hypothetical protein
MVWLLRRLFLCTVSLAIPALCAQESAPSTPEEAHYDFFSGIVADLPAGHVTVSRTALGKSENRSFIIGPETKIEGKLRTKARVTVRYRNSDEGDVAVHIIVRSSAPSPQPPKKSMRPSRAGLWPTLP